MDEEYSDNIEELSYSIYMEWTASHAELKEKLSTLDKQITIVHKSSFLKSKPAIQGENKTNEYLLLNTFC